MFDWKHLVIKAASLLGYSQGYQIGYQGAFERGIKSGKLEAQSLAVLMQQYGSFDAIPTAEIHKYLPNTGHIIASQQMIKLATIRLQKIIADIDMPLPDNTVTMVIKFLEYDPSMTVEEAAKIDAVLESNSCFGALISLAEQEDHLDVELFMRRIREPLPTPHLDEYYACLKNEHFVVR